MSFRYTIAGIILGIAMVHVARADAIITASMLKPDKDGMPGETQCEGKVDLGEGIKLPFHLHVTNKGNGAFELANLKLRLYDSHDNGLVYKDSLLQAEIVDLAGDGSKFLVISGTAIHTGDKEADPKAAEGIVFIYRFDPKTKHFDRVYKHARFDLEM